jgi:hypothetical protein
MCQKTYRNSWAFTGWANPDLPGHLARAFTEVPVFLRLPHGSWPVIVNRQEDCARDNIKHAEGICTGEVQFSALARQWDDLKETRLKCGRHHRFRFQRRPCSSASIFFRFNFSAVFSCTSL